MHLRHLLCTDAFAGVERYVTYAAIELARRGHVVEVIGGDPARMAATLEPHGVTCRSASSPVEAAQANLARPRPDLVHAHMTAADIAAVVTRPFVRRPVVSTLHFAHRRGHSTLTRAAYRSLRPFLAAELATSAFVAEAASGNGPALPVVLNGIPDPGAVDPGRPRRRVVLIAQRLEAEKDTATALRAWQLSGLRAEGWVLQVAGRGAERATLDALVATLDLGPSVEFLGLVDDVAERMATASLLLATAPAEPFGLAVVEAMAAGLAVVAADGGGHSETVAPATPDTLFPPGDAAAAAEILRRLAHDEPGRTRRGALGRKRFLEELTIERHVDRLEAVYRRVLTRRTRGLGT